jgi:hypothetical protein
MHLSLLKFQFHEIDLAIKRKCFNRQRPFTLADSAANLEEVIVTDDQTTSYMDTTGALNEEIDLATR